jgi:hypothetical protein
MCIDGMGMSDLAMNRLVPGPSQWPEYWSWARGSFDLTDDSWNAAGALQPWRGSLPYCKMIHSIYLLTYGLSDNYAQQWHAQSDYRATGQAASSRYHGRIDYRFNNDHSGEARAFTGQIGRDHTKMRCQSFNAGGTPDGPANRAGVMVHESWHHWQHKYDWSTDHESGGAITAPSGDWYYRHSVSAFDFGALAGIDLGATPIKFHSPYQIHVEWLADIAEYPQSFVPVVVRDEARAMGNNRLPRTFKNKTSYRIGDPRPF